VKKRINFSGIHKLLEDDHIFEEPKAIEDHIFSFHKHLYSNPGDSSRALGPNGFGGSFFHAC